MNKLSKIGASALCGSLAAISAANAGELTVTGGVDMSWISKSDQVTGNPIGMGSNLTFTGSGELDNGWSVALSVADANASAYSNTNVTVGIPGLGDLRIDQGVSATGIDRIDDVTPNVWEEAYGTGLSSGIVTPSGGSAGTGIEWTPSSDLLPAGATVRLHWSPNAGGSNAGDKSGSGVQTSTDGSSYDATLSIGSELSGVDGLTIDLGMANVEQDTAASTISDDREDRTVAITYAMGSWTAGYQWSETDNGTSSGALKYTNDGYGITFNVNDDLSIGYNHYESEQDNATDVKTEAESIQIAYTMGGASIRLADAKVKDPNYSTSASDIEAMTLSVSLAF
jgi:outer membrane protein OmpU